MQIPTFYKYKYVDAKGELTPDAEYYIDLLNIQMQKNLSDDGFVVPSRTTVDINTIADPTNENTRPDGTLWYDTDLNELKVKINGIVKVVQVI